MGDGRTGGRTDESESGPVRGADVEFSSREEVGQWLEWTAVLDWFHSYMKISTSKQHKLLFTHEEATCISFFFFFHF